MKKLKKHRCVAELASSIRRVNLLNHPERMLKRPVVLKRFYACMVCGKDMTNNRSKT